MKNETEIIQSFETEIISILRSDLTPDNKVSLLDEYHDYELSQTLLAMDLEDRRRFFLLFKSEVLANIIAHLDPIDVIPILKEMHLSDAGKILNEMQGDDLVDILQAFDCLINFHGCHPLIQYSRMRLSVCVLNAPKYLLWHHLLTNM